MVIIVTLVCVATALWWRLSLVRKQNAELQAEVFRLRGRLRALRV